MSIFLSKVVGEDEILMKIVLNPDFMASQGYKVNNTISTSKNSYLQEVARREMQNKMGEDTLMNDRGPMIKLPSRQMLTNEVYENIKSQFDFRAEKRPHWTAYRLLSSFSRQCSIKPECLQSQTSSSLIEEGSGIGVSR